MLKIVLSQDAEEWFKYFVENNFEEPMELAKSIYNDFVEYIQWSREYSKEDYSFLDTIIKAQIGDSEKRFVTKYESSKGDFSNFLKANCLHTAFISLYKDMEELAGDKIDIQQAIIAKNV